MPDCRDMIKCIGKTKIFTRPSFRESFLGMQSCAAPTTISLPCFVLVVARNFGLVLLQERATDERALIGASTMAHSTNTGLPTTTTLRKIVATLFKIMNLFCIRNTSK